jgi:hypothetical protein
MIVWIIITATVLMFIVTSFIKLEHDFKAIKATVIIVIILIIGGSVIGWYKYSAVDLSSPKAVINSVYVYFSWVGQAGLSLFDFSKGAVSTVGNTIKSNQTIKSSDGRR